MSMSQPFAITTGHLSLLRSHGGINRIVASWGPVFVHRLVLGGEGERRIWLCHDKIYPPPLTSS